MYNGTDMKPLLRLTYLFAISFICACVLCAAQSVGDPFIPISSNFVYPQPWFSALKDRLAQPASASATIPGFTQTLGSLSLANLPFETTDILILERDDAVRLGYLGSGVGLDKSTAVILESWRKFIPLDLGSGIVVQYGVAINMVTRVDYSDVHANALLKAFSADASFKRLKATVSAEVLGLSAKAITDNLPTSSAVLERYRDILRAKQGQTNFPLGAAMELASPMSSDFLNIRSQVWTVATAANSVNSQFLPVIVGAKRGAITP